MFYLKKVIFIIFYYIMNNNTNLNTTELLTSIINSISNGNSVHFQSTMQNIVNNYQQPNVLQQQDAILLNRVSIALSDVIELNTIINNNHYIDTNNNNSESESEIDEDEDGTVYYNNLVDIPITLDKKEFNNFKVKSVTNRFINILNQKQCNICLDYYKLKEKYITLTCKHNFHYKCIQKWLCENSIHCPTCRKAQK
jgi:hypothetical protein